MSQELTNTPEKRKRKKILLFVLLVLLVFVMVIGILAAFFSDYIFRRTDLTAGTLKISGTYTFLLNEEAAGDNITDFKPGDVVVVRALVQNNGNLSAWVRDEVALTTEDPEILPHIQVYLGEFSVDAVKAGGLNDSVLDLAGGVAAGDVRVLNGSGEGAQTESGGDFDYVDESFYQTAYTIYFLPTATNEAQGKTIGLNVATKAIQFRNNNAEAPSGDAWTNVAAVA